MQSKRILNIQFKMWFITINDGNPKMSGQLCLEDLFHSRWSVIWIVSGLSAWPVWRKWGSEQMWSVLMLWCCLKMKGAEFSLNTWQLSWVVCGSMETIEHNTINHTAGQEPREEIIGQLKSSLIVKQNFFSPLRLQHRQELLPAEVQIDWLSFQRPEQSFTQPSILQVQSSPALWSR